jgi:hypothetical protein
MKAGQLAYSIGVAGERTVDHAELDRVFPIKVNGASLDAMAQPLQSKVAQPAERERIIAAQKVTIAQQAETIRELWVRLAAEAEERRRLLALLAGPARVPWWRRWFR